MEGEAEGWEERVARSSTESAGIRAATQRRGGAGPALHTLQGGGASVRDRLIASARVPTDRLEPTWLTASVRD